MPVLHISRLPCLFARAHQAQLCRPLEQQESQAEPHKSLEAHQYHVDLLDRDRLVEHLGQQKPLVVQQKLLFSRLGINPRPCLDVLELFLFVRPAQLCAPTLRGLTQALDLPFTSAAAVMTAQEQAAILHHVVQTLLDELQAKLAREQQAIVPLAGVLSAARWPWSDWVDPIIFSQGHLYKDSPQKALAVWQSFSLFEEQAPRGPAGTQSITAQEVRKQLAALINKTEQSEVRAQQMDYAISAAQAFAPQEKEAEPQVVMAEAGTGTGKTLGYLAPSLVWANKNQGAVWISTFTRALQGQLDRELERSFPAHHRASGARQSDPMVAVRKGRENYACLLNFEEACQSLQLSARDQVFLALFARWLQNSKAGELIGADFPIWVSELFSHAHVQEMADKRGECLYTACLHYKRCFIEKAQRKANQAKLVILNHALSLRLMAQGAGGDHGLPARYIFDEGHHLFEASDSVFCAALTGYESSELRRWLLGREDRRGRSGRKRGLFTRYEDIGLDHIEIQRLVQKVVFAANALPSIGWYSRIKEGQPQGAVESFLLALGAQVYGRAQQVREAYSIECSPFPLQEPVLEQAKNLIAALKGIITPLKALTEALSHVQHQDMSIDSEQRRRIESLRNSIEQRALAPLNSWISMLESLLHQEPEQEDSEQNDSGQKENEQQIKFVDWFGVLRSNGQDRDLGFFRHLVDPTKPFMDMITAQAQGALITSAMLGDSTGDPLHDHEAAKLRSGTRHLAQPALYSRHLSPFSYADQAKIFIIEDLDKQDMDALAGAYQSLFEASKGGALGLFTSISRLKSVQSRILSALEMQEIALLSQHIDAMDASALIEIFASDTNACLLGTDALRDGIDVPGLSLRMVVMERVPWPRPSILHQARRNAFGGRKYDEILVRFRLKQAFGRLIRRKDDRGVFVMLDRAMPSRLLSAFPKDVEITRLGLSEACARVQDFL